MELEARRLLAVQRVAEGWSQKDVAAFLGVHWGTVAQHWGRGDQGLKAKPTPGRPGLLTGAQECQVLGRLGRSPTEYGFDTDLRTARRVAEVIHTRFGVRFHPSYLREWLSARNCSPQKPARPARQRDQPGIDRWVARDWKRIQKRPGTHAPTSS